MYAIKVNEDNSISTLIKQSIYQGYKALDWFWILVNPEYQTVNISDCNALIKYTLPISQKIVVEKLKIKPDLYEGQVKFVISSTSKITSESGIVIAKIIFMDKNDEVVRQTSQFSIGVSTDIEWHNDIDFKPDVDDSNCHCDDEEHIEEIVSRTKPLVFNSVTEAESKLNSGTISNIYYGQAVIINKDGKYLSYTVQSGTNGYIVEPVDTVGEFSGGLVWQEN